jgi:DNA-binding transcriptional regulator YiaG
MTGAQLKSWRRRFGVTQQQLAVMLDVSVVTISGWETGRFALKHSGVLALACLALELTSLKSPEQH